MTGQYSIAELRRRLIPWGTYQPRPGVTKADHIKALQTRLHLNSFRSAQPFLKLLPLPVPQEPPRDLPDRVFPVTVISCNGRAKPIVFGLNIPKVGDSILCLLHHALMHALNVIQIQSLGPIWCFPLNTVAWLKAGAVCK